MYFYQVDYLTRVPVETAYIGSSLFDDDESLVFLDNDNIYNFPENFFQIKDTNFIGCSYDTTNNSNYSYVLDKDDIIFEIAEKRRISNLYCCEVYGFKNIDEFRKYAKQILNNEYLREKNEMYMSDIYKLILKDNSIIKKINFINQGNHIGTLNELSNSLVYIEKPKLRICFDLDNTLVTYPSIPNDYTTVKPIEKTITLLRNLYEEENTIIIYTARRMKTYKHNLGEVIKDIGLITFNTLEQFNIPYHEIIFGKPYADIYIDDRSINPYKNDYNYLGIFNVYDTNIINVLPNNKFNKIELINNKIIRKGPIKIIEGELYMYKKIKENCSINKYFPLLSSYRQDNYNIYLELEYLKGIPLYILYKQKLLSTQYISKLVDILNIFHSINDEIIINIDDIRKHYLIKLKERFKIKEDYPFENVEYIQTKILNDLNIYLNSNDCNIVPFIHGDYWLSNIILTFDQHIKVIDMRGKINNILTSNGDPIYDYCKLYQSLLGFDCVIYNDIIDDEYKKTLLDYYEHELRLRNINITYLRYVTIALISGTIPFYSDINVKSRIWLFISQLLKYSSQ